MRIWIVNHYALPPGASGGPTRHLGLSRELVRRGHDVTIIASAFDHYSRGNHRDVPAAGAIEVLDGVTYVWVRTPSYANLAGRTLNMATFAVRAMRMDVGSAPDVVIGSSPHLLAGLAASRMARAAGAPFVFEVRDLWPQSLVDLGSLSRSHPLIRALARLERRLYRTADHVVVVPQNAVTHVLSNGGRGGRVSVLQNGVDLRNQPPLRPAPRDGDRFTITYAGTLGLANGLGVVVNAAAELRRRGVEDVRFRIVGKGPEHDALADRIAARQVGALVSLEPAIPSDRVPVLLADADACLLVLRPSPVFRWGISPTKLFDYLAAGRPVISMVDAPEDASVLAGAGIRCAAGDAQQLADAALALRAMSPDERDEMGLRGRAYVEQHHSFENLAARLEALLEGVISCSPP